VVCTFSLSSDGDIQETFRHESLREASADLPKGAYTTFRTYRRNRVLRLDQHLRRLEETLSLMGEASTPIDPRATRHAIGHVIERMGYAESRFRLTHSPAGLFISIEPFTPLPQALYDAGVWCVIVSLHRDNPHAKSTAFIASASQAYRALPDGAQEGLMVAEDGAVLEGLSSNFFAIVPEPNNSDAFVLRTEEQRVLLGVTRSLVLEVAQTLLPISTQAVTVQELPTIRECFITSVSREILPVVKINDHVIGDGYPGPATRALMARFADLVAREAEALG
jgi:branched-chain amino acid aminotransferase